MSARVRWQEAATHQSAKWLRSSASLRPALPTCATPRRGAALQKPSRRNPCALMWHPRGSCS